jgi:ATP-dependent Lhr-like helicase
MRTLRQGVLGNFRADTAPAPAVVDGVARAASRSRRSTFRRWSASRPFSGRWRRLAIAAGGDAVDEEERNRERVRLLADRYGVLFRELLAYELPELGWRRIARTLRTMELGGELIGGHFFEGIPGLQFASPEALRTLERQPSDAVIWWHSATDPASLCGVDLPGLKSWLPRRMAGTYLVWMGARLALVVRRMGRELDFAVESESAAVPALLRPLEILLTRGFDPLRSIEIETINGQPAAESPYLAAFSRFSRARTAKGVRLRRSYTGS